MVLDEPPGVTPLAVLHPHARTPVGCTGRGLLLGATGLGNQPSPPALFSLSQGGLVMDRDDPEQAADRHARAAVMGILAVILAVAIIAAFITTLEGVDTGNVTQPGTIGLAKPHPPLDRASGEPVRN
jgi:hypothetical protein